LKLPQKIDSRHKIRDASICTDWSIDSLSVSELSEKYHLTERRIYQILTAHHAFIHIDKEWEKKKRIHLRNCWIKDRLKSGEKSKKDLADLLDANRMDIDGDKPLVDNSVHQQIIMFRNPEALKEANIGTRAENRAVPKDAELSPR
jgi:hypothetical protein